MNEVVLRLQAVDRNRARRAVWRRLGARMALATAAFAAATAWAQVVPSETTPVSQPTTPHVSGAPLPSSIPVRRDVPSGEGGDAGDRWWAAILVVGGLLTYGIVAVRRKQAKVAMGGNAGGSWLRLGGLIDTVSSREIERVSSTRLSPRHSLHVVVWNGKRLLLGCTDQSIQVLSEASTPQPVAPTSTQEQG